MAPRDIILSVDYTNNESAVILPLAQRVRTEAFSHKFKVFGLTWPGFEPVSYRFVN